MPSVTLYETTPPGDGGRRRTRTWHWLRDLILLQRTLITEHTVG
jgi:hypothetical protein